MKKLFFFIVVSILSLLIIFLIAAIALRMHSSKIAEEKIKILPIFSMKTINDSLFNTQDIKHGPVLVLYFHPECEHCQYQLTTLFRNWEEYSEVYILLISDAGKELICNFVDTLNIKNNQKIKIMIDDSYSFADHFGTSVVPSTFIYNKKLILVKYFHGEVKPETVLKYLKLDD
jgi:peroxiredoxin